MHVSGFAREVHLETKKVHSMVKKQIAIGYSLKLQTVKMFSHNRLHKHPLKKALRIR
jgi:hypothetical protein